MNDEKSGTLVLLACHCVFDPAMDRIYAEHVADHPIYDAHLNYAFKHVEWRADISPLLVISGAPTKIERHCSESRSYLEMANMLGLKLPTEIELEEYALTSIENLLLSIYVFHRSRNAYPESIEVISWEFKRKRFEKTLEAINQWSQLKQNWPSLKFFPCGDLWGKPKTNALFVEDEYINSLEKGVESYYTDTGVQAVIQKRDVYSSRKMAKLFYAGYPLPF